MYSLYNRKSSLIALLIAFITVLVFLPALQNDFVNWDDPQYIYENFNLRNLDLAFFTWASTSFYASNWHPLTWISHAIDYAMWGLNPMGHHLTSIILHALNTFLVVVLVTRLVLYATHRDQTPPVSENERTSHLTPIITAAVTGLLFGIHPLHIESVAWVSERKDVLYAFFYLLSILWYMKYVALTTRHTSQVAGHWSLVTRHPSRVIRYCLCLLFFVLSLMSKPMAVTLPVVLIILDFYPLGRLDFRNALKSQRKVLMEKLPFLGLSLASSQITIMASEAGNTLIHFDVRLFGGQVLVALRSLGFYLFKMLWPTGLVPLYPYPSDISLMNAEYLGSLIFVVCVTAFCVWSWRARKVFFATWAYYVVSLLPVLGIIRTGLQSAADRYAYLPCVGPFLLIGIGLAYLYERIIPGRYGPAVARNSVLIPSLLIVCLLSVLTVLQIRIWKDSFTLWSAELRRFPDVFMAHKNLGEAYQKIGMYNKSITHLDRAVALNPKDPLSYYDRGLVYGKSGQHHKAVEDFNRAITLNPRKPAYYNNLGVAYGNLGDYPRAMEHFNTAIALDVGFAEAYFHRGVAHKMSGSEENALRDLKSAARMGHVAARDYLISQGIVP
jgi:hypothetical protein